MGISDGELDRVTLASRPLIGSGTWCYTMPGASTFEETASKLAAEGYDGIELDGGERFFHYRRFADSRSRRRLLSRLRDLGIAVSGYNPDLSEFDITSPSAVEQRAYLAAATAALEFGAACGFETMRLETGQPPPDTADPDHQLRIDRIIATWTRLARIAGELDVRLAWEFEPGFFCNKPSEVVQVVEAVGHPAFGVLFDASHAHMISAVGARQLPPRDILPGGAGELAHRLTGHINLVHLIDSDETIHHNFTSTHSPFGQGVLDFPRLLEALVCAGYRGRWWTVDLCFCPDPFRYSKDSAVFVRQLLASSPALAGPK